MDISEGKPRKRKPRLIAVRFGKRTSLVTNPALEIKYLMLNAFVHEIA
jgi:hypothetical protein